MNLVISTWKRLLILSQTHTRIAGGRTSDLVVVIQLWVPPTDKERIAGGRTRMTVDLFGQWHPFDQFAIADMENYKMPPASVRRSSILLGPVDLDDDGKITFQTLDKLADLGLDLTGLRWTRTKFGNAYRQYRLFTH